MTPKQEYKKTAALGVKWTVSTSAVTQVLNLLRIAVLARVLEPTDFGLMGMVMVVIGFAQAFQDMGISNAIIQRQDATRQQLSSLYFVNIFGGIIVFIAVYAATPLVIMFFREPRLKPLMVLAACVFLIIPLGQQFRMLLLKEFRFKSLATVEISSAAVGCIVAILCAIAGFGVISLVLGELALAATGAMLLIKTGWKKWPVRLHFRFSDLKGFASFGLYQMGQRSINYFAGNIDKLLIGRLLGAEIFGYYSIAWNLMMRPMRAINPAIARVTFPIFSRIQNENERLKRGYLKVIELISFINIPIYLGMFAVADPLFRVYLGEGWGTSTDVFKILVFLGICYSFMNPLGSLLLAKGRADLGFGINVVWLLVAFFSVWLGSKWGIEGIALALVLGNIIISLPSDFFLRWRVVHMHPLAYLRTCAPFLFFAASMSAAVLGVDTFFALRPDSVRLLVLVLAGVLVYAALVMLKKRAFLAEMLSLIRAKTKQPVLVEE